MKGFRILAMAAIAGICLAIAVPKASAQVNINIGVAPACPYGYFDYAPYNCAPFGYYGPSWFSGGIFIGAGPWFGGPEGFRGYVDRRYDPRFGYRGYLPGRGERADWGRHRGWEHHFHGTDARQEYRHDNGNHYGQYKEHGNPHDNGRGNDHGNGHGNGHDNGHGHGNDR
jgi:hypothetical protein